MTQLISSSVVSLQGEAIRVLGYVELQLVCECMCVEKPQEKVTTKSQKTNTTIYLNNTIKNITHYATKGVDKILFFIFIVLLCVTALQKFGNTLNLWTHYNFDLMVVQV